MTIETTCPSEHPIQTVPLPGYVLCGECADRIWRELYWIADMHGYLVQALTRRLNVEKAEQVKVHGGKDPMVRGLELQEEAVAIRHTIRTIDRIGTGWIAQRGLRNPVDQTDTANRIRWIARNLHWLLSDTGNAEPFARWAGLVISTRLQAEILVTPQADPVHRVTVQGRTCQTAVERIDRTQEVCGGEIHIWANDPAQGVCDKNPAHIIPRETLIRERQTRAALDPTAVKILLEAITRSQK